MNMDWKDNIFMLPFGANYVTFWRKNRTFMLPFGANYVTFWRKLCYLLAQFNSVYCTKSNSYEGFCLLINNFKNNLINYSNKLFYKGESRPQKLLEVLVLSPLKTVSGCIYQPNTADALKIEYSK